MADPANLPEASWHLQEASSLRSIPRIIRPTSTTLSPEKELPCTVAVATFKGIRYVVKPQKPNDKYEYTEGYAIWDQAEKRQVGWHMRREGADESVTGKNDAEYIRKIQG